MDADGWLALLRGIESRRGRGRRARPAGAVAARRRGAERAALRLPRRRADRGAPHAGGAEPPLRRSGERRRSRPARRRRDRQRARGGLAASAQRRRDARGAGRARRASPTPRRAANAGWAPWLGDARRRPAARRGCVPAAHGAALWVAAERLARCAQLLSRRAAAARRSKRRPSCADAARTRDDALRELLRARLGGLGPVDGRRARRAARRCRAADVEIALLALQAEGYVLQGRFTPRHGRGRRVVRAPPAGAHPPLHARSGCAARSSRSSRATSCASCSSGSTSRATQPRQRPRCARRRARAARRLRGAGRRVGGRDAAGARAATTPRRGSTTCAPPAARCGRGCARAAGERPRRRRASLRATPIAAAAAPRRAAVDARWRRRRGDDAGAGLARAQRVADYLAAHGASFFDEIADGARLLRAELEDALAELVVRGRVNCDSFAGLRALLVPAAKRIVGARAPAPRRGAVRHRGRGALVADPVAPRRAAATPSAGATAPSARAIEHVARILLRRYGVVCWRLLEREAAWLPPWRELVRVYRRLEARGEIRGGRFIAGADGRAVRAARSDRLDARGAPPAARRRARLPRRAPTRRTCSAPSSPGPKVPRVAGARVVCARRRAARDERRPARSRCCAGSIATSCARRATRCGKGRSGAWRRPGRASRSSLPS